MDIVKKEVEKGVEKDVEKDVERIARQLIAIDSVTSASNAQVSDFLADTLTELGFDVVELPYVDSHGTPKKTLAAKRAASRFMTASNKLDSSLAVSDSLAGIGFFCHSDVVSVDGWDCPHGGPFSAAVADKRLWGRGACDMKGPIAAALAAISRLDPSRQRAPVYFFVTGDEECGMAGARSLTEQSEYYRELVEARGAGLICEPTSLQVVNAHKGGCHLDVTSTGVAAHSSTAEGRNANWPMIPFLHFLGQLNARCESEARFRNVRFSPPTLTLNLVIENQPQSSNITVGLATCRIFFRPMPATDWQYVMEQVIEAAHQMQLQVRALPPLAPLDTPLDSPLVQTALRVLGQSVPQVVSYATDGCCFEQLSELIVIGPGNIDQAHRPDEWIELEQLRRGVDVYQRLLEHYASS